MTVPLAIHSRDKSTVKIIDDCHACRGLFVKVFFFDTMTGRGRDNGDFSVPAADNDYFKEYLAFNYAKLIFWFVSFAALVIFVYLYTKDMRERFIKSEEMLAALEMENTRLNKTHSQLQQKNIEFEVIIMQKNAQMTELEHTVKELRKSLNAV